MCYFNIRWHSFSKITILFSLGYTLFVIMMGLFFRILGQKMVQTWECSASLNALGAGMNGVGMICQY